MAIDRGTSFTSFGHSAVHVQTPGGKVILIDPWLNNPKSPVRPEVIPRCDLMLVTHGHYDHFGDALAIASRLRPAWPCIHEMSLWLARRLPGGADQVTGMNKGGTVEAAGIKVTMTTAHHSAGDWNSSAETTLYLGDAAGFVVEVENGFRFYFAGDTSLFSDMRLIGEFYHPELALLPIGGHFTMGPREAAMAVELLGVKHVIPIHYGTFPILAGTPDELRAGLRERGLTDVEVHAPQPGETVS